MKIWCITWFVIAIIRRTQTCQFYPPGEYLRFVRVPENLQVGQEFLRVDVFPRRNLSIQPIDKSQDVQYFTYRDLNRTTVSLLLARSLEEIVDSANPQNVLKFKLVCDYDDGEDVVASSLSVTVYVEDLNDHAPIFEGTPYEVTVEELTPVGLTIFRGILATDGDKPNTPNSDIQYSITGGNEKGKFALDNSQQALLQLKKPLDYDTGDKEFVLTITASDRGTPPKSSNTTVKIHVQDNDDLSPKFTKGIYRTRIKEFYPLTGERIHKLIKFDDPIYAYDQDLAIDTPIRYDIIAGNERHLFYLDHVNGSLFLEQEIDLDAERSLPGNTFVLQIQASQLDNPLKTGVARVEIEVMDLNDNLPEFEVEFYNISIVENLPNGFSVLQIIATDQDQGDNGEFGYQLDDKSGAFALDARSGWLTVRDQTVLDREKRANIKMRVYAKEKVQSIVRSRKGSASSVEIEVTLLDANDNNPTFVPNNVYEFTVTTNLKKGDIIGQVNAIDPDLGRNGHVLYSIQKSNQTKAPFKIDKTGQIILKVDKLQQGQHILFVEASDQPLNPSEKRISLAVVTIIVKSATEDGLPDFIGAPYEFWVGANVDIGTSVGQIRVTEFPDKQKKVYDLLHSYHEGVPFAVEESSGTITVVDELENYDRILYDFEAVVTNENDITLITNVTINVVGPNEESMITMKNNGTFPIEFHVKENQPKHLIGQLLQNNTSKYMHFSIANEKEVLGIIMIDANGSIYNLKPLDREEKDVYRLTVIAEYTRGVISGTGIYQVTIFVDDVNDNAPQFERQFYEGKIKENSKVGTELDMNYQVHAIDADSDTNGKFNILIHGEGAEMFRFDKNSGRIYFNGGKLDRETRNSYQLKLVAKDEGGLFSQVKFNITVEDENDNTPIFVEMIVAPDSGLLVLEYGQRNTSNKNMTQGVYSLTNIKSKYKTKMNIALSVPEDLAVGNSFMKLRAEDNDANENAAVKYELVSETYIPNEKVGSNFQIVQYFIINRFTGDISISKTLPAESEFRLNISASDNGNMKDYITVKIFVRDVNNHQPVFKKSSYNFDAEEASYTRKFLGRIEATDADFGSNANISYKIQNDGKYDLPFEINEYSGVLNVNGILDRETKDKYTFRIIAKDNPHSGLQLSSSVTVDVNVLDVNDNAPTFYGYDDIYQSPSGESIPVYYSLVPENSPIGTPINKVFANDTDFMGNGNGLILFDIPYKNNKDNLFTIDSKEGIITTIGKLDYEKQKMHNITIIASDLGSPSLSSTALLIVTIIDVPEDIRSIEHPVFAHRYYEVEVEENVPVPLKLLTLNVTEPYRNHKLRYSIVADNKSEILKVFKIDSKNGTLYIISSPDRETKALYELRIRLDQYKVGRDMTVMVYPITSERLGDLGFNEVKVIVRVIDVNDNVPKFTNGGRPYVVAIPTSANFGFNIMRVQTTDPDIGLNGEVRYQILSRVEDGIRRFAVDPITGQVRAISSFTKDAGKVFGFDVKATDRRGADDGKSAIANVFVYVLDEQKQLIMTMNLKPTDVEKDMDNITWVLQNATGYDVRIRKLEPHIERNQIDGTITDMYIYAVDPKYNVVVDMDLLQRAIQLKQNEIERMLEKYKVLGVANNSLDRQHSKSQRILLSTLEIGVVVLGCIVFIGAFATAICVVCIRRRKNSDLQKSYKRQQPLSYTLATSILGKPTLIPASFGDGMRYAEAVNMEPSRVATYPRQHDINCPLYGLKRNFPRDRRSVSAVEKSVNSLHSSGHDSGIVDGQCQCGQSPSHSSEESSNSYEDSLKSASNRRVRESIRMEPVRRSRNFHNHTLQSRSFSDDFLQHSPTVHRGPVHLEPAPALLLPGSFRSSDRLLMACPINP